jgi:hypothetical protein
VITARIELFLGGGATGTRDVMGIMATMMEYDD